LPPSPPASIHGSEGEREGLQGREGEGSGLEKDETNDAGGNGIDDHIFPLPQPIARRNTTGSIQTLGPEKHHPQISKSTIATPHNAFPSTFQSGFGEGSVDLASDIYKYSERIRRERNLKRAKQQHREHLGAEKRVEVGVAAAVAASGLETEPSPSATHPGTVTILGIGLGTSTAIGAATVSGEPLDENPLVGNLIGEGHVNYVLMYNMLTGIRIAVSRCGGKMMRPIAEEDFRAEHKYSFDM
jgi:1-phosphatidylinositol-4-phosphate 5-kinase